ncbi:LysR family transcriptional regulator [Acetobacter musti]|uniref:LysR family transcriptional regulator n=1 Tax=Acetobacter musti TaxID=864732 RepID=A0ABX0JTF6_9PROT|nr:LysR family transcriptional regulator [Acetobacter musti]NHN86783.1 LysR family transcriptional regulator [Acetobacter musti]
MHAVTLRYLLEVARRGSVRSAAQILNVAASAVNRQIIKLEAELGVRLFDRLPSGMRPTQAGEILLRHVRHTVLDFERSVSEIDALSGMLSGHIRIAALDSFAIDFLPSCIETLASQYSAATFSILTESPRRIVQLVQDGEIDVGLTFDGPLNDSLRKIVTAPAPIGALMTPEHPFARRTLLSFDDLKHCPSLLFPRDALSHTAAVGDSYTPDAISKNSYAVFREMAPTRFNSSSIEFSKRMILAGLAIGFFTKIAFQRELEAGSVVWVPVSSPSLTQLHVVAIVSTHRTLPPVGDVLLGILQKRFKTAM